MVDLEPAADPAVIFDGLDQLEFVLFSHARQLANLALAREFFDAVNVADFVGAPDQRDRLRSQTLDS